MIKQLIKLADHLDKKGLQKEADYLDRIIVRLSTMPDALDASNNQVNKNVNQIKNEIKQTKMNDGKSFFEYASAILGTDSAATVLNEMANKFMRSNIMVINPAVLTNALDEYRYGKKTNIRSDA